MKRGFLERIGLVEVATDVNDVEPMDDTPEDSMEISSVELMEPVDVPNEDILSIDSIYAENGMENFAGTIYKVDEMIQTMPQEMPNATKKVTILGMMNVVGITVDEVKADAENRVALLGSVVPEKIRQLNDELSNNNDQIEALKQDIENLQKRNKEIMAAMDANQELLQKETDKISGIVNFISGGDDK